MADEDLGSASVTITLDDDAVDSQLNRLSDRIERALSDGARDGARRMQRQLNLAIAKINPLRVEITADTTRFRAALNSLNNLGSSEIRVVPGVDPERFRRELQRRVRGIYVRIPVRPDFDGFDERVRAHRAPPIDVRVNPNVDGRALQKTVKSLTSVLGKLGGIAGLTLAIGGLGIAAAGAAAGVGLLVAALAPAAGIIAAGPAAVLGYAAALGSLKLALSGVGDAFSAALTGDAKKFDKALEDLSPQAKKAAQEVRALKPAFESLRNTVQDAFFSQFEGDITRTATALQGPLTKGLAATAEAWGNAAAAALGYIQGTSGVTNIQTVLTGSATVVQGLAEGTNKLTAGFLQAADAVTNAFAPRLSKAISDNLQQFGTFLQVTAGDGRLVAWVDGAINVLKQLGALLGNIGGILTGVFGAASAAGGGFLTNLTNITQKFETFVKSAAGQEAITNIFRTLAAVAAQLGPIFTALVQTLGSIAPALAPLFTAIGPAIQAVIGALGPAIAALLPGIRAFVDALVGGIGQITSSGVLDQVGAALGGILTAVAPLLPVVGQLVAALGQVLAPVLQAVAEAVTPIITALAGALTPIIPPLVQNILKLVDAVAPLLDVLGVALAAVITAVSPLLLALSDIIGSIVAAVAPLIVQLANALIPIIQAVAPVITRLVNAIAPLIAQLVAALLPVLPPIIDAFIAILDALTPLIEPVVGLVEALAPLIALIISAIAPVLEFAAGIVQWLTLNGVVPIIQLIVTVLTTLVTILTDVVDGVVYFVNTVIDFFSNLDETAPQLISDMVDAVTGFFSDLQDRVIQIVAEWVVAIRDKFVEMKDDAGRKVAELVASVVGFFKGLPGRAGAALSSLGASIAQQVGQAASQFIGRVQKMIGDAVRSIAELPGKAKAALGGLGSLLFSAGQDIIRGLINGVKSMAGALAAEAKSVASGAVKGVKNFLGIKSPSKVFYQIGRFVGQGLVNGLTASEASIKATSEKLAKLITDAFKGKAGQKTRLDDSLLRLVSTTNTKLTALVRRREALAERIKQANEFAAATTKSTLDAFDLSSLAERSSGSLSGRGGLIGQVESAAARIRRFTAQLQTLAKRGLRKDLLSQLISLGPEAGADLANQLSRASSAQLRELNAAQKQLDAAAKKFGQQSADQMFDAGKDASKGFLAGLKSQQKAIQELMVSIAKSMTLAIKRALGIKSPSRVLRAIGVNTGEGLVMGIDRMRGAVALASRSMARAVVAPFATETPSLRTPFVPEPVRASVRPLDVLADPFGRNGSANTSGAVTGPSGRRNATAVPTNVDITNNFTINEVGNAEATAHRVVNRLTLAAGVI